MSISEDDVYAACREIEAAGHAITNDGVRAIIGRGSLSTITPLVRAFRDERHSAADLPNELEAVALDLARRFWLVAKEEAASDFCSERRSMVDAHTEAQSMLKRDLSQSQEELERTSRELTSVRDRNGAALSELSAVKSEARELVGALEKSEIRRASADERRADAEARIQRLEEKLDQETAANRALEREVIEFRVRSKVRPTAT